MNRCIVKTAIPQLFRYDSDVAAVYLFGAQSTGKTHTNSLVYLAILFTTHIQKVKAYFRLGHYFAKLSRILKIETDIVDLICCYYLKFYETESCFWKTIERWQ